MAFFLVLALLLVVVAVIFAVQNTALVTIAFFSWNIETSLAIALLAALGAGILIVLLLSVPGRVKSGWNSVSQKKKFSSLEAERDSLKQTVETTLAERDDFKVKLGESEKEISKLEEQLASISAMVPEREETSSVTSNLASALQTPSGESPANGPADPITEKPAE